MNVSPFWLVWCPTGANPPRHRHNSYQEALGEAERLSECAPRAEFFVMQAISQSKKVSVVTTMIGTAQSSDDLDKGIPF